MVYGKGFGGLEGSGIQDRVPSISSQFRAQGIQGRYLEFRFEGLLEFREDGERNYNPRLLFSPSLHHET